MLEPTLTRAAPIFALLRALLVRAACVRLCRAGWSGSQKCIVQCALQGGCVRDGMQGCDHVAGGRREHARVLDL